MSKQNSGFIQKYQGWQEKFSLLEQREKLLTLIAAIVLVLFIGYPLLIESNLQQNQQHKKQRQQLTSEQQANQQQLTLLQAKQQQDPDQGLKAQIQSTRDQLQQLQAKVRAQTGDLVPATQMAVLLESILSQSGRLTLLEMQSLPVKMINTHTTASDEKSDTNEQKMRLYQHGVDLTLEGRFFDIYQYLQQLESLPQRFYWQAFSYQVQDYPLAQVRLRLYTLSMNEAFLGV